MFTRNYPVVSGGAGAASSILQIVQKTAATNQSTNSVTPVDLTSVSVTISEGSDLWIIYTMAGSSSVANSGTTTTLLIDSVTQAGCGSRMGNIGKPRTFMLSKTVSGLSAGSHTIAVQWSVSAGIMSINALTNADNHHFNLLIFELAQGIVS